jgi:hypothetical protein
VKPFGLVNLSKVDVPGYRLQYLVAKGAILRKGFVWFAKWCFPGAFSTFGSSPTQTKGQDKVLVSEDAWDV